MNVLMLLTKTYRHDPRVSKEAEALLAAGHAVTVLEWARHHPDQPEHERINGVHVVRTVGTRWMRSMPGDMARNPLWWRHAADLAERLHRQQHFDVVHAHDLDTLAAGVRFKRRTGARLVFDAHERFDLMITGNVPWPVPAVARRLERAWGRHADLIVTASDTFTEHYATLFDAPAVTVWNAFGARPEGHHATANEVFTVHYIGTLSRDRFFPDMVHAIGEMPDVRLVLGGKREGVFEETEAAAAAYRNVEFLGPVPHEEVLPSTCAADAILAPWDPRNPQYRIQVPNKLFDAMHCGRPLVATEGTGPGRFVREHEVGLAAPYTKAGLQEAVRQLRDDPDLCERFGANGQELARTTFHWDAQRDRLVAAYEGLSS